MTRFDLEPLRERVTAWKAERERLHEQEAAGVPVRRKAWRRSGADAVAIAAALAELMGIGCISVWTVTVEDHTRFEGGESTTYAVHAANREHATAWAAAWHAGSHDATHVNVVACEAGMPRADVWEDARAHSLRHPDPAQPAGFGVTLDIEE